MGNESPRVIDEQRIAEAEGWLRECWPRWWQSKAAAAYQVLGLSGTLRALARFVEEEERTRSVLPRVPRGPVPGL